MFYRERELTCQGRTHKQTQTNVRMYGRENVSHSKTDSFPRYNCRGRTRFPFNLNLNSGILVSSRTREEVDWTQDSWTGNILFQGPFFLLYDETESESSLTFGVYPYSSTSLYSVCKGPVDSRVKRTVVLYSDTCNTTVWGVKNQREVGKTNR